MAACLSRDCLRQRIVAIRSATGSVHRTRLAGSLAVLDNDRLDLAVARGAAYYGMVRRGEGVKIVASLARTYYIGVESEPPDGVSCLVPGSAEPGQTIELTDRSSTCSCPSRWSFRSIRRAFA